MTAKELRDVMKLIAERHDDCPVELILTGHRRYRIKRLLGVVDNKIVLEGEDATGE